MNRTDLIKQLLEEHGWEVECESPFEIRHKDELESFASGSAVWDLIHYYELMDLNKLMKKYDKRCEENE